jgi:hypothetical protein
MKLAPVRYESLDESPDETGYVIGARIIEMSDPDRAKFDNYLTGLLSRPHD